MIRQIFCDYFQSFPQDRRIDPGQAVDVELFDHFIYRIESISCSFQRANQFSQDLQTVSGIPGVSIPFPAMNPRQATFDGEVIRVAQNDHGFRKPQSPYENLVSSKTEELDVADTDHQSDPRDHPDWNLNDRAGSREEKRLCRKGQVVIGEFIKSHRGEDAGVIPEPCFDQPQ